jgi:hypothetical protein
MWSSPGKREHFFATAAKFYFNYFVGYEVLSAAVTTVHAEQSVGSRSIFRKKMTPPSITTLKM